MHVLLPTTSFFNEYERFFVVRCNDNFLIRRFIQYIAWIGTQTNIHSMSYSRNITRIGTTLVFLCRTIFWLQNHVICFVRRRRNIRLTKEILEQWTLECGGALVELNCNVWMNIERDGIIRFSLKRGFILNKYTLTIFET